MSIYRFKLADTADEFEQIHRLNYQAFVEEIPQHTPNQEKQLIDKFHDENHYVVGLCDDEIIAMIAIRAERPFSLDQKLNDLDRYLPARASVCELRLLYIVPKHRNGKVMRRLLENLRDYCMEQGYDFAIISGTTRQQRLYRHLGFVPFGPLVGAGDARFQPMYLTLNAVKRQIPWMPGLQPHTAALQNIEENGSQVESDVPRSQDIEQPVNFLPGPVNVPKAVQQALAEMPVSHRSDRFLADVRETKEILCDLVGAQHCEFLFGSGTLTNEAVAAQLSRLEGRGIVLSNGEFGGRLVQQARRWQLDFVEHGVEWGAEFDYEQIRQQLEQDGSIGWVWAVHCETSTGMLNDIERLSALCAECDALLCLDCVSSVGAVPLRLDRVHLATAASGKALASLPGIGIVFYNHPIASDTTLPSYLDLGKYAASDGVPFTISSNLLYALHTAVKRFDERLFTVTQKDAQQIRHGLRALGLHVVCPDDKASPAVTTIALPTMVDSVHIGDQFAEHGYLLSYKSGYLVERNWIQICLMGEYRADAFDRFLHIADSLQIVGESDRVGVSAAE